MALFLTVNFSIKQLSIFDNLGVLGGSFVGGVTNFFLMIRV